VDSCALQFADFRLEVDDLGEKHHRQCERVSIECHLGSQSSRSKQHGNDFPEAVSYLLNEEVNGNKRRVHSCRKYRGDLTYHPQKTRLGLPTIRPVTSRSACRARRSSLSLIGARVSSSAPAFPGELPLWRPRPRWHCPEGTPSLTESCDASSAPLESMQRLAAGTQATAAPHQVARGAGSQPQRRRRKRSNRLCTARHSRLSFHAFQFTLPSGCLS